MSWLPPHILDRARQHVANTIRTLGTAAGTGIDYSTLSTWETAAVDFVLDSVTGRSLGQWVHAGTDALADFISGEEKKGTDVTKWADIITSPVAIPHLERYAADINKSMSSTLFPELLESAPSDPVAYGRWVRASAKRLGMTPEQFVVTRAGLSPNGTDHW